MQGYICRGDLDSAWVVADSQALLDPAKKLYFLPEARSSDLNVRKTPPPIPGWAAHKIQVPSGRSKAVVAEALNGMSSWNGGDLFVSQSAMEKLKPHVAHDCVFLPAEIQGVSEPYFLLWITTLLDALDADRSTIRKVSWSEPDGSKLSRVYSFAFREDQLKGHFLFRIPGEGFSEDCLYNFATDNFLRLVEGLQISGFVFSTSNSGPKIVPVGIRGSGRRP